MRIRSSGRKRGRYRGTRGNGGSRSDGSKSCGLRDKSRSLLTSRLGSMSVDGARSGSLLLTDNFHAGIHASELLD